MKKRTIILATALIAAALNTSAEIPIKTQQAMQNSATEKVQIEVQNVKKKKMKRWDCFDLDVKAKVISVNKSGTGVKVGDILNIRYIIHNPKVPPPSGSYPGEIKKGKTYMAYLDLSAKDKKVYSPAAASGSFVQRAVSGRRN
ncbi:MAG: hypothetical protein AB8F34_03775 [Akkermansiaceae bacterium]